MQRARAAHRVGCKAVAKRNLHSESGDGTGHVHPEIGEGVTRGFNTNYCVMLINLWESLKTATESGIHDNQ